MKLRRPSPALVISIIALFIAAGTGGAIAQSRISGSDIRNSSITSTDIKNRSLLGADMKRGTLTLSTMSKGTQNLIKGAGGGGGASTTAAEAVRKTGPVAQPANTSGEVTKLALQPGAYVVTAKAILSGGLTGTSLQNLLSSTETATGSCRLDVGGESDIAVGNVVVGNRPSVASLQMQTTRTLGAAADAVVTCSAQVPFTVTDTSVIATKVASLSRTG